MSGRFSAAWLAFLGALALLAALVVLMTVDVAALFRTRPKPRPLVVFCAAGLRKPVEDAAREYEAATGVGIRISPGGSDTLLNQIAINPRVDLYIPADDSYLSSGRAKGLLDESVTLGSMHPVLAVKKGNPKSIASLEDVIRRELRVAQANPEAAAVGRVTKQALVASKQWDAFSECIVVNKPTVNDVANDVALGSVDAGFVWDATVRQADTLETVPAKAIEHVSATLSACVVRSSDQPAEALRFARYLASSDKGAPLFERHGFTPARGDVWVPSPELHVWAGAMLQPAIKQTLIDFEQREGVRIMTNYNGCGVLVAEMQAKKGAPDVYFACDKVFMDQVQPMFGSSTIVSGNQLVILVHKGNPYDIKRLSDLGKEGLRVGIGHEKQCAMGVLTQRTLKEDKSSPLVMKNVVVQTPTGDMLVNQMRTGSLDAAVAYISNAAGAADKLEAIPIDIPCAFAEQPFAIAHTSAHKKTCERLLGAVLAAESRERFAAYGFTWKASKE